MFRLRMGNARARPSKTHERFSKIKQSLRAGNYADQELWRRKNKHGEWRSKCGKCRSLQRPISTLRLFDNLTCTHLTCFNRGMQSQSVEAILFGGAMELHHLPSTFTNIAIFRQVPDHQEVFVDNFSNASLMVELLELKEEFMVGFVHISNSDLVEIISMNSQTTTTPHSLERCLKTTRSRCC